jgi:hypothetical protein
MYHVKGISKCSNTPCSDTIEINLMEKSITHVQVYRGSCARKTAF